ncbi:MAG: FadR/GntR family transcriptional regulator [Acidimicrobiales bacterium]
MTELWQPVKSPGNLTNRIVARIEELLANNEFEPGGRLPAEREMARLLGVSRPALREAVKVLEARGRLVVRHGQGMFVALTAPEAVAARLASLEVSLRELFDMRIVLEEPAAAWAAEMATAQDVAALAEALAAEEPARIEPIDFDRLKRLDTAFHLRIVETAKNRFLHQTLDVLQEMLAAGMETTLKIPGRVPVAGADHRRIFDAIVARDADAARAAVRDHIAGARDAAMRRIREESGAAAGASDGAAGDVSWPVGQAGT